MALIRILMRMAYYTIGDCDSYVRPQYSKDTLDIINGAIEMVTCNMSSPVKIKDIAAALNISERKLYKHFEDMFGMSPGRYFTNFKIKKAEDMLLGTDMTLEQISEALGFSSPFICPGCIKRWWAYRPATPGPDEPLINRKAAQKRRLLFELHIYFVKTFNRPPDCIC